MGYFYGQLSQEERIEIYHFQRLGLSVRAIGLKLSRSASTISRELWRNGRDQTRWRAGYCPVRAHRLSKRRRQVDKSRFKLVRQPALQTLVRDYLAMGWSPLQIAGRLTRLQSDAQISHESIYRYIYYRREQKDYLCRQLPQARSRRRPRRKVDWFRPKIPGRVGISKRPDIINERAQSGHWETDIMQFSMRRSALLVSCERTSRFLMVAQTPDLKSNTICQGLIHAFEALPQHWRRSVTFDNGSEFFQHQKLAKACNLSTWFCDPHCPWQKGSVENAIGRLRRYLPRKTNIENLTTKTLKDIIDAYNSTPRACLDYRTPKEVYSHQTVALHS